VILVGHKGESIEILSLSEITEKDKTFSALTPGIRTIEDYQRHIFEVPLAEQVPEEVRRVFDTAARLCVYGWFEYIFCTVSYMIALMGLECALKHRFILFYGGKFDLAKKGKHWTLETNDFERLWRAIAEEKWQWAEMRKFRPDFPGLARWARAKGLVSEQSFLRIRHGAIRLRNSLAHPSRKTLLTPGNAVGGLNIAAQLMNEIFSDQ